MATTHVPGTGFGPHGGKHARRAAIIAAVVLAGAAIVVPFAIHALDRDGARASAATPVTGPSPTTSPGQHTATDATLGPRGSLPALLPGRTKLSQGAHVRLGDITSGVLRRSSDGTWQVMVRWNGRLQAVHTRGPVPLVGGSGAHASATWISADGRLYTRVPSGGHGQFRVYAWDPRGGDTAYTPPSLVATSIGRVCFNHSFTDFGDCKTAG